MDTVMLTEWKCGILYIFLKKDREIGDSKIEIEKFKELLSLYSLLMEGHGHSDVH
jgi:hypothetical protein